MHSMRFLFTIGVLITMSSCSHFILNQGFKKYKSEILKSDTLRTINPYQKDLLYLHDLCLNSFPKIDSVFPEYETQAVVDSLFSLLSEPTVSDNQ